MDTKVQKLALTQAQQHAEFLGEYTKYIYKQAHYHGFKHGFEYAQENKESGYLKACEIIAKDLHKRER